MKARKSLGQHFLMHAQIAERIVLASGVGSEDVVFEIGPGTGQLTRPLLAIAKHVIALEADGELVKKLGVDFAPEITAGKLELIHGDIRTFDPRTLPQSYALVANIPYYLTGEILRMFLETERQPRSMTLLVQKEVAVRIAREKKGSLASLAVKAYATPHYAFTVPKGAFLPAPSVDSAVLSLIAISRQNFTSKQEEALFFKLLHAGFAHKRKFLVNNLREAGFGAPGIAPKARAEDLALADWLTLTKKLAL